MSTLVQRLDARVREEAAILSFHGTEGAPPLRLTYGQVVSLGELLAGFVERPVEPGARVILILPQGPGLHGAFFACLWHGLVPSILAYPTFKMSANAYRAQITALCTHLSAARIVTDARVADLLRHLPVHEVTDNGANDRGAARPRHPPFPASPDDVAFLQHSAGTTGLQKGVALRHGPVLQHVEEYSAALGASPRDRIASWLPLYHDMGLIACLVMPMALGIPSASMSPTEWVMRPLSILHVIAAERSTLTWWPNFTFPFLARRAPPGDVIPRLDSMRAFVNCSEPVTQGAFAAFLERFRSAGAREDQMSASYAMAENTFAVTQTAGGLPTTIAVDRDALEQGRVVPTEGAPTTWTSSGKLFGTNRVRIVGDDLRALAPEEIGEILVRSDALFSGYWGRPDLTEPAFVDGWYRTGDLGFLHDGELFVTGRKRDLLIVGGRNLYPQDIEEVAAADPAVHDGRAVAVGLRDEVAGTEDLVVAVETHAVEGATGPDAEALAARVRKAVMGAFEVAPRRVLVVPPLWLIKSSAGKISRSRNRDKIRATLRSEGGDTP